MSNETDSLLLENKNTGEKSYQRFLKRHNVKIIVLGILVLSVMLLCLLNTYILRENRPESDEIIQVLQTNRSPRIFSTATTNNDFFKQCAPSVKCNPNAKYRSVNGSCNNLITPTWGASKTPFFRTLNADYNDGYYEPRKQSNGDALPNVRTIHVNLFMGREVYRVDENNVLLLPFGQLLAHDITGLLDDLVDKHNNFIDCCTDENVRKTYSQCQLILLYSPDDPFYQKYNVNCSYFYRALTSRNYSCPLYPATFINENTHFIDASQVYGSNENDTRRLRLMVGGRLNYSISDDGQVFCPLISKKDQSESFRFNQHHIQYDTGDRNNGNQNYGITAMQTLFLRYHNYVAYELTSLNPHWSDETLFQESRRIVIATIQRIAYEDFLPLIIGEDFQDVYGLYNENVYDPTINPATSIELSAAVFRVLHTLIPVQFNLMNRNYKIESSINVNEWLTNPELLQVDNNFDKFLKGFLETPGRLVQPSYNFDISNYLFITKLNISLDLMAVDISRGRDTGLSSYNQVRHLCGSPLAEKFDDLMDVIHEHDISKLKKLYYSVNDIDLLVGLLLEKKCNGAIVGPTTRCLIADSFYRYKVGDRFFYDVRGQPGSFTSDQLKTIKKITLGHVMCAVSNVDHVQAAMFKIIDHNLFPTSKHKCDDFQIDFGDWTESNSEEIAND